METITKTKRQLVEELEVLQRRLAELEKEEAARKRAEELFQNLALSSPVGIYIVQDGKFSYTNPRFQKYTGYREEELLGMNSLTLVAPEDREMVRKNAVRMLKGEYATAYEYRAMTKGGDTRWILETVASIQYQGRRATVGTYVDITEHKQAEGALRESEERYRALLNLGGEIGEAIVMLQDTEQGMAIQTYVSDQWSRITSYSKEELLGMSFFDLVHPEYREASMERHWRKMQGENIPGLFELSITRKDGTEVFIEITSAHTTYQGKPGNVAYIREITERKLGEERLIVTDRLASVGELASGIAHELNNPLTAIIGFSQLLMEKDVADDVKEDVKIIHREAQRTADVVKNLLTFARKHAPVKELANINSIVGKVLELRAYEHRINDIQVITQLDPDLPEIIADYFQIQQVFLNIVINAEHFMIEAHGRGKLTITTEKVGDIIRVVFADDGPGIPKENLGHLFDPFFTTKEVGKGTGLGLSICHGIVTEHGGRIYAESKLGKGATFTMELPITIDRKEG